VIVLIGAFFTVIHFAITALLIAGILVHTTKSEGLGGTIGGGSDTLYRGSGAKGFEAFVEKMMVYMAWGFLGTSLLVGLILPKFGL
jgi:protein translocase SecG subunit